MKKTMNKRMKRPTKKTMKKTMKRATKKTMKKTMTNKTMSYEDVDYATDIDMLTILSKKDQTAALSKVNAFLKTSKNKKETDDMTKRKKQIEALIKGE